ncbi:MAG: TAXI family TRAP transporter solute-binding subunit [Legionellales bacterium]|nr:TAXI family TRAP transporter solute-binding subunit [Legionellales bacterium]
MLILIRKLFFSLLFLSTLCFANLPIHTITIGTGKKQGLYYPLGQALCNVINQHQKTIHCGVIASHGSLENLLALEQGKIQFAIIQSDWQFHAYQGNPTYLQDSKLKYKNLRSLFSLYNEPLTIIVRNDSAIRSYEELKNKIIDIGQEGSGSYATVKTLLHLLGWQENDFHIVNNIPTENEKAALCQGKIDALIEVVGHPNQHLYDISQTCPIRLITIPTAKIHQVTAQFPFYTTMTIRPHLYRGNSSAVTTFGVQATLITTTNTPDWIVYEVTKMLFTHFSPLKYADPLIHNLQPALTLTGNAAPFAHAALRYYQERGWKLGF